MSLNWNSGAPEEASLSTVLLSTVVELSRQFSDCWLVFAENLKAL